MIPLGATVKAIKHPNDRETGLPLTYRVCRYGFQLGRVTLKIRRLDGKPCFWESARVPVYEEEIFPSLVQEVTP